MTHVSILSVQQTHADIIKVVLENMCVKQKLYALPLRVWLVCFFFKTGHFSLTSSEMVLDAHVFIHKALLMIDMNNN